MLLKPLLLLASASLVVGKNVSYTLIIENFPITPDGFTRSAVLANRTYPAPIIKANKGDRINIKVVNKLTEAAQRKSTAIHWHGLFQARTASEDGPAFVNQCPIPPGVTYEYNMPTDEQAGTFWYHSHLAVQYADGLRGSLIVYDPNDPMKRLYDVDDDSTVIQFADWYHGFGPALMEQYNNTGRVPNPESGLINGLGRFNGGPESPLHVLNVIQNRRYRLRLVSHSARTFFTFSIDNHNLTVIEADGITHRPHTVQSLEIYAAQRYSAILVANQPVGNYWMRAPMTGGAVVNPGLTRAILRYRGAPIADPTTEPPAVINLLNEADLHPLENPGSPGGNVPADVVINLQLVNTATQAKWMVNGNQYLSPSVPTLLNILRGATVPGDFGVNENTFVLPRNKIIEVRLLDNGTHPFHLHGHAFDIIKSGRSEVLNFVDPPRRDVVALIGTGVIFRFKTDNPGPWFLHCHIDWHLEAGLAVVFAEAPADQRRGPQSQIIKQTWLDLCTAYDKLPEEDK